MIPYFIAIANPDYKKPSTHIITNYCENNIEIEILSIIVDLYVNTLGNLERFSSIFEMDDSYYSDNFMNQPPIFAKYFESGEWKDFHLIDEDFFKIYKQNYLDETSDV